MYARSAINRAASLRPPCRLQFYRAYSFAPLRVLFCGADRFSAVALKALTAADDSLIRSIDVVCKQGKPAGRGQRIRERRTFGFAAHAVPIKAVASDLGLAVHEISTFTGWTPPTTDLIIAVSFGLLVPQRTLHNATLRGPAPLQHTILQDLEESGVTVQTLHPTAFDKGDILAQEHVPLRTEDKTSYATLQEVLALKGSSLLVDCLRKGLFIPPVQALKPNQPASEAPKVTIDMARIDWVTWTCAEILRRQAALGSLWSTWPAAWSGQELDLRIKWHKLARHAEPALEPCPPGQPVLYSVRDGKLAVPTEDDLNFGKTGTSLAAGVWTADRQLLTAAKVTVAPPLRAATPRPDRNFAFLHQVALQPGQRFR